jgi:lipopolysaccharide/colanic/teichoic acid biosynthesis glycosyltransferase
MENINLVAPQSAIETKNGDRRLYPVLKRLFDITCAFLGLVLLAPFGILIAVIVKVSDWGPVLYRQRRVGQHNKPFDILKFRTMVVGAEKLGPSVTRDEDPRITRIGRMLRKTKLDELPQLWNVLIGNMSFVGPRPEVPRYVDRYTPEQRQLLNFKPGITDLATLVFRDEETLLRGATDVEDFYVKHCIPRKFRLNLQYAQRANVVEDVFIILETLCPYWLSVICTYILALAVSLWLAYHMRFDFIVPEKEIVLMKRLGLFIIPLQLGLLMWRRQFVGLLSYFDAQEMKQLFSGLAWAAVIQMLLWFVTDGALMPDRKSVV